MVLEIKGLILLFCFKDKVDGEADGKTDGKAPNGTAKFETPINISDEVCKTSLWKQFARDGPAKQKQPRRRSKSSDKHKSKHKHHHHKNKHRKHRGGGGRGGGGGREEDLADEEEGLWMLERKGRDDDSDSDAKRKLSIINEEDRKDGDVIIDMEEIQKSLLELNNLSDVIVGGDDSDRSDGEAVA